MLLVTIFTTVFAIPIVRWVVLKFFDFIRAPPKKEKKTKEKKSKVKAKNLIDKVSSSPDKKKKAPTDKRNEAPNASAVKPSG